MREIKFRGKYKNTWYYGSFVKMIDWGESYDIYQEETQSFCLVEKDTVGQYTGLEDKNGVEIYEGDIVKVWADLDGYLPEKKYVTAFIRFDDVECYFGWVVDYRYAAKVGYYESIQNVRYDIEVIGNIYDNPELLEVEQ